jgi:hypothetical protein
MAMRNTDLQLVGVSMRLAVAAMRTAAGVAGAGELETALPEEEREWDDVMERMYAMRLSPLLHRTLADSGLEGAIPPSVGEELHRRSMEAATVDIECLSALGAATAVLEEGGFTAFAIKGAALSIIMPQYAQLRRPGDIDLWVPGGRSEEAHRLMQRHGYANASPRARPMRYYRHCVPLIGPDQSIVVELHRRPWLTFCEVDREPVSYRRISTNGATVCVPALEELIVIQASHASVCDTTPGHILTLMDVARMANSNELDWEFVEELSRRIRSLRGVQAVLSRVALLELAEIPRELRMANEEEAAVMFDFASVFPAACKLSRIWRRRSPVDSVSAWLQTLITDIPSRLLPPGVAWRCIVDELGALWRAVACRLAGKSDGKRRP